MKPASVLEISRTAFETATDRLWERVLRERLRISQSREHCPAAQAWQTAQILCEFGRVSSCCFKAAVRLAPEVSSVWIAAAFPAGCRHSMRPPPLAEGASSTVSWIDLRRQLDTETLSTENAVAILRCFGKPSLGTQGSMLRRLEWFLPPVGCVWHPWAKEALWRFSRKPICASAAKRTFKIAERDLQQLRPRRIENPHHRAGPPMRLYEIAEVARIAQCKGPRRRAAD